MDKKSHAQWNVGFSSLSIPKLQRFHRWSLEWMGNFISHNNDMGCILDNTKK